MGVPAHVTVVPATVSPVRTRVVTEQGDMAFQEYFVARRCTPVLRHVVYEGIDSASPAERLRKALDNADAAGAGERKERPNYRRLTKESSLGPKTTHRLH